MVTLLYADEPQTIPPVTPRTGGTSCSRHSLLHGAGAGAARGPSPSAKRPAKPLPKAAAGQMHRGLLRMPRLLLLA